MIRMTEVEFDKLLTAALYRAVKLDYADMPSGEELDKTVQPSEDFKQKMKTLLQNPKKSIQSKHRPKRPLYFKILRVAAAVLITFTLLIGSAMVVSPTVRAAVINIVRTWFSSPNEIRYGMNIDDVEDMIEEIKKIPLDERTGEDERALLLLEYYLDKYNLTPPEEAPKELSYLEWHPYETQVEVDLTGDGKKDKITLNTTRIDEWSQQLTLHINDKKLELTPENGFLIFYPADGFVIVDIDKSDSYLEIAISDYGPSGSATTCFFRFVDDEIIFMGLTEGSYDGTGIHYINIPGNGEIISFKRAQILQTWWFTLRYTISDDNTLVPDLKDIYIPVNYDCTYFVLMDFHLYKQRDESGPTILMERNTLVTYSAHDNNEWIEVTMDDGQTGWFRIYQVEEYGYFAIKTADADIPVEDVFFMLGYAG